MDYDGTRAHVRHCRSKSIAEHIVFRTVSVTFMHLLLYILLLFVLLYATTETRTPDDLSHI